MKLISKYINYVLILGTVIFYFSCGKSSATNGPNERIAPEQKSETENPSPPPWPIGPAIKIKDVETLNIQIDSFLNKKITVNAEVTDVLDNRSMLVESGGYFNNEVSVVAKPEINEQQWAQFKRGTKITVTGALRRSTFALIRAEVPNWEVHSLLRGELQRGPNIWIVAQQIQILNEKQ